MIAISAATFEQACLAAKQLGIEGRPGVDWIYASDRERIMGLLPTRAIFVQPYLRWDESLLAAEQELGYRAMRAGIKTETVWT